MRPYLAIIKDSFREATASRVLWVLLGVITIILLLIAPLGVRAKLTTGFSGGDIRDPQQFVAKLRAQAVLPIDSPAKRIWSQWDEERQKTLIKFQQFRPEDAQNDRRRGNGGGGGNGFGEYLQGMASLYAGLKELVQQDDFYRPGIWREESLPKEARDYIARRDKLSIDERARLNRILIEGAIPGEFNPREKESIAVGYLWMETSESLPFTKTQTDSFIKSVVVPTLMKFLVGIVGIFVAILVTSPVIPQMFEPGSINLLLSKPVQRSAVYLSKFVGGCAFTLLNVGYLCVGLWLIAGLRYGIWNRGILLCIPIFLFLFSIYYSISALTGIIWKSAVVSVVLSITLWLLCFIVGVIKVGVMEPFVVQTQRLVRVVEADGTLIGITEQGVMQRWKSETSEWERIHVRNDRGGLPVTIGPIYHSQTDQLLLGEGWRAPFGLGGRQVTFQVARGGEGWLFKEAQPLPDETAAILVDHEGSVLAVAKGGVFRLQGKPSPAENQMKFLGMPLPFASRAPFVRVMSDDKLNFPEPLSAALNPITGDIAVYSRGTAYLLSKDKKGNYSQSGTYKFSGDENQAALIAIGGNNVVVSREDGKAVLLSPKDLTLVAEKPLEPHSQPRTIASSPDGKQVGILFHNQRLWMIDTLSGDCRLASVRGQGDISGFTFQGERLLVADRINRVSDYQIADLKLQTVYSPAMTTSQSVYYYLVSPIYTVFPKPGELDNTVQFLITEKETTDLGLFRGDLSQARGNLNPWQPVWSSAIFVTVMLALACVYIERHQF